MAEQISDEALLARVASLTDQFPSDSELVHILNRMDSALDDELARDRYVAIVSGGAVLEALRFALASKMGWLASDDRFQDHPYRAFKDRIRAAVKLGIVSADEAVELRRIMRVRHVFAHSISRIGFEDEDMAMLTSRLFHHPVSDYSAYFAPAFPPRTRFAIVCAEFVAKLTGVPRYNKHGQRN